MAGREYGKTLYTIPRLDGGMIDASVLIADPTVGIASDLQNVDLSKPGILKKRPGVVEVLDSLAAAGTGLHEYIKMPAGTTYYIASAGENVYKWDSVAEEWTSIRASLEDGAEFSFKTFAQQVAMVNYEDASALWDGTTITTPADFPKCRYLAEYKLRLAAIGVSGDASLLSLCHTSDPTIWDPDAVGSNAFEAYVSPDDGEGLTGALNMGDSGLLLGKASSLYGLFGYTSTDFVIDLIDSSVGSASHKAMQYMRPYAYFVNRDGIFRMQMGQPPERISLLIQDLFDDEVDLDNLADARAFIYKRYYVISLPTTDAGEDELTLAYHIDREAWVKWTNPLIGEYMYTSDADGRVYYIEPGGSDIYRLTPGLLTDKAGAITARYISPDLFTGAFEVDKDFADLYLLAYAMDDPYEIDILYNVDYAGWQKLLPVEVSYSKGNYAVIRAPIQVTGRLLQIKLENSQADKEFSPVGFSLTLQSKGLL